MSTMHAALIQRLPSEQIDEVFHQEFCEIDYEFLGFTEIYEALSRIIPIHFTVIDFGCGYNPQSFYFEDHRQYVAIDECPCVKFKARNCELFTMTISEFIAKHAHEYDQNETFAICSYVPPWGADNMALVRNAFTNVFTYYPHGERIRPKFSHILRPEKA